MKTKSLLAMLLIATTTAFAQTTVITMTTENQSVDLGVKWTGAGSIIANGVSLENNYKTTNTVPVKENGQVEVIATGSAQITVFNCSFNTLTDLNIINCPELRDLDFSTNYLTNVDFSKCSALKELSCYENPLTDLDVSKCPGLIRLSCSSTSLKTLDLSKCSALARLYCQSNFLSALDVTKCPALTTLFANNQTIILPIKEEVLGDELIVANPVLYNGTEVRDITPNEGGVYTSGSIIWKISESEAIADDGDEETTEGRDVSFTFTTKLPAGVVEGEPFGGVVHQPWIVK